MKHRHNLPQKWNTPCLMNVTKNADFFSSNYADKLQIRWISWFNPKINSFKLNFENAEPGDYPGRYWRHCFYFFSIKFTILLKRKTNYANLMHVCSISSCNCAAYLPGRSFLFSSFFLPIWSIYLFFVKKITSIKHTCNQIKHE